MSPIEFAASIWPLGVFKNPLYNIAEKYPEKFTVRANNAWHQNGHTYENNAGIPNAKKNNCTIKGVFLINSTYAAEILAIRGICQYRMTAINIAIKKAKILEIIVSEPVTRTPSNSRFKYSEER